MKTREYASRSRGQAGFTIVELLIATIVFSVVLLLIAAGVLKFNHAYYAGITQSNTQNTARTILEDISQAIQFSGGSVTPLSGINVGPYTVDGYCFGNVRYSYVRGWELEGATKPPLDQTIHAVVQDSPPGGCGGSPQDISNASLSSTSAEMLGLHMRVSKLSVSLVSGTTDLYLVDVRVVYGDNALLNGSPTGTSPTCKVGSGSQFCAVSELSTVVQKRV